MSEFSFEVSVDEGRNVLRMTQRGLATAAGIQQVEAAYRGILERLRPGFVLLNNQLELEGIADDAQPFVEQLVKLTNEQPIHLLIRVVPAALVANARLGKLLVKGGFAYKTVSVHSVAEAERVLDEDRRSNAPR